MGNLGYEVAIYQWRKPVVLYGETEIDSVCIDVKQVFHKLRRLVFGLSILNA